MGFWRVEWKAAILLVGGFLASYHLPVEWIASRIPMPGPLTESLSLVRWYAREHVLLCLVPAFFIAGAIGVFISQDAVMKYLGPQRATRRWRTAWRRSPAPSWRSAPARSSHCSRGIYKRGAGLGPATAFLYSGPAINVLAIVLTARVLGVELGVARAVGAVVFSVRDRPRRCT